MEIPFLKNKSKNDGGGGPIQRTASPTHDDGSDDQLVDHVVDEFFRAIETKNKALLKDALGALITYIQDEDRKEDSEMMS